VTFTEQYPKGLGHTIEALGEAAAANTVIEKIDFAATEENAFMNRLGETGRRQVILIGMEAHICVYQTALGLVQSGYQVHVLGDGVATRLPENTHIGLGLMQAAGCLVTSAEAALFQLLEKAGTAPFKKLQKLIL